MSEKLERDIKDLHDKFDRKIDEIEDDQKKLFSNFQELRYKIMSVEKTHQDINNSLAHVVQSVELNTETNIKFQSAIKAILGFIAAIGTIMGFIVGIVQLT